MVMIDRFPLARHSLSFLFHFFPFLSTPRFLPLCTHIDVKPLLHRETVVALVRAQLTPSSSHSRTRFIFDILIQRVTRYTDAVCSYVEMLWIIGLLDVLLFQRVLDISTLIMSEWILKSDIEGQNKVYYCE